MSKEPIPVNISQEITISDGEKNDFLSKRESLISELRCITGLTEVISSLNQDTVYKLVLTPDGAKLFKDANGNLKGVFYKNGKIVEHAKLQQIGPSMFKAAKVVGAQILLVSIAMQLNRIEAQIGKIFEEFHGDRLAEIEAGKSLFRQACRTKNLERRESLTLHAISELTCGFEKTVSALSRQIDAIPEQKLSLFDNWFSNKSKQAEDSHKIALESFSACLSALQILARCYLFLEERDAAIELINDGLSKIEKAGVNVAYVRSRLVPKINGTFPEEAWHQFIEYRKNFDSNTLASLVNPDEDVIEIEITPNELMEFNYAKM